MKADPSRRYFFIDRVSESKTLRVKTAKDSIVRYGNTKTANFIAILEVIHRTANQKTVKN